MNSFAWGRRAEIGTTVCFYLASLFSPCQCVELSRGSLSAYSLAVSSRLFVLLFIRGSPLNRFLFLLQVRKLQERVQRAKEEVQRTKEKYEAALQEINSYNPKYIEDMQEVFDKCQQMEAQRLVFFKDVLFNIHKGLNVSQEPRYRTRWRFSLGAVTPRRAAPHVQRLARSGDAVLFAH